jgi:general secretion pathway protein A
MVKYRIEKASDKGGAPSFFTYFGLWALYLATGGYPRKIVTLCHQVILALIIQNKSKAGWFLVRSSSQRVSAGRRKTLRWATVSILAGVLIVLAALVIYPERLGGIKPPQGPASAVKTQETAPPGPEAAGKPDQTVQKSVVEAAAKAQSEVQSPLKKMPDLLGNLKMKQGRTVWWMIHDFYGDVDPRQLRAFALANPHIKNLNRVRAGERVSLPAIPAKSNPFPSGNFWVNLAQGEDIDKMYDVYKRYETIVPSVKFIPHWNDREGLVFAIYFKDGYPDADSALAEVTKLPKPISAKAKVSTTFAEDTVFFRR